MAPTMKRKSNSPPALEDWSTDPATPARIVSGSRSGALEAEVGRLNPGTVLADRYRIVSLLGRGGMGEIYRAEDLKLGVAVSLKFLPPSFEKDPKRLELLLNEVKVARQISHPNVCRVHDVGEVDGLHFISMEYVAGEDLRTSLRRVGRLSYAKALELARQLADALAAAHGRGVLHRDLKPSNLMIDGEGNARIVDFGIAVADESVRGPEAGVGTPAYMSPEQLAGEAATARSDLYMLGLVLYELFTGRHPFRAASREELVRLHREAEPEPPSALVETMEPVVERTILGCLEKDPLRRPASAAIVAEALLEPRPAWMDNATLQTLLILRGAEDGRNVPPGSAQHIERLAEAAGGQWLGASESDLWLFRRPVDAVRFALEVHESLGESAAAIGIHLGEVVWRLKSLSQEESAIAIDERNRAILAGLSSLARGRQILLTQAAFDLARRSAGADLAGSGKLRWLAHGGYQVDGVDETVEIGEVGIEGFAPLEAPPGSRGVERLSDRDTILGWRPAPGLTIPQRPRWELERKLGEGGFGEVWLARHGKTAECRAFKFCYDASRLRAFQREITLFRLLKEELGERGDIARIHDWSFDEAPYFIESEYSADGNLEDWARRQGGLEEIDLEERLEIVAQVAIALAAAHSVGVLHKDVKPSNVLMRDDPDRGVRARLADFGIGAVTETQRLAAAGITVYGFTEESSASTFPPSGTHLYMAPETLEGRTPSLQADIYALGVMLYQMLVGDFSRALAPGWERDVEDELLREDLAAAVDGRPEHRLASAAELAERLRTVEVRRAERMRQRREREEARQMKAALVRSRRRRRVFIAAFLILAIFAGAMSFMWRRVFREAETARQVSDFVVELFEVSDPEKLDRDLTAREVLDRGARRIEGELAGQPAVQARMMQIVGEIHGNLGLYGEAASLLARSLEIRRDLFRGDHAEIAESASALADVRRLEGKLEEADEIAREALAMRRQLFGEEHLAVAETHEVLGRIAFHRGMGDAAEVSYEQALDIRRRLLGDEHLETAATMALLGDLFSARGDHERARALLSDALATHRRLLGDEHPRVATILQDLGGALHSMGALEEAEAHYEEALSLNRRIFGDRHSMVASSLNSLAILARSRGDVERSEALFEQSLGIYRESLGADHPYTVAVVGRLASLYRGTGDNENAERLYRLALDGSRRALGERHPMVANHMLELAELLLRRRAFGEAEGIARAAIGVFEEALPPEHWMLSYSKAILGTTLRHRGRLAEAEELLEHAVRELGQRRGEEAPQTKYALRQLELLRREVKTPDS